MTIKSFKNIVDAINFHVENIYGTKYSKYGFSIYRSIEKVTGKVSEVYYDHDYPVSKERFLELLNGK